MAVFRDTITDTGACIKQNYMNLLIQFIMTVINYISYQISITKPKSDEIRYLKIEEKYYIKFHNHQYNRNYTMDFYN